MNLRDERQVEFANSYLQGGRLRGILNLCPRFGKCRVGVHILQGLKRHPKVLIAYPHKIIEDAWKEEFGIMKYTNNQVTFTTHLSMHKFQRNIYDIVIIDEIHLLSEAQIGVVKEMGKVNPRIVGLTGTLSSWTERTLKKELKLEVIARYSIEEAVKENVITDYLITVKTIPLDATTAIKFGKKTRTEKSHFDAYSKMIAKMEEDGRDTMFLRLARKRIIQGSISKLKATKALLSKFPTERILVFCGLTSIASAMGCPSHHSKAKNKKAFDDFATGVGNHFTVVKIGNTGSTYKPLNKVIINSFSSNSEDLAQQINRCMAIEYSNPNKRADIWIVTTDEQVELDWLKKALEFFDKSKIRYI